MSQFAEGSVFKNNPELLRICQNGYVMYPRELPRCSVAAIAKLAGAVGGVTPDCGDPDCEHHKLQPGFHGRFTIGMSIARAICLIEEECGIGRGEGPVAGSGE